jgi:hypothetical protein
LPREKPLAIGDMSRTKLDEELKKGMESLENGKTYSIDEVDEELHREFGIRRKVIR